MSFLDSYYLLFLVSPSDNEMHSVWHTTKVVGHCAFIKHEKESALHMTV